MAAVEAGSGARTASSDTGEPAVRIPTDAVGSGIGEIKRLTDKLYIAGQITQDQIRALAAAKPAIASILNLRKPGEGTFLHTEAALCTSLGLHYEHVPMFPDDAAQPGFLDKVLAKIDAMPAPVLVHCASAMRAGALAVAHAATREQLSKEATMSLADATPFGKTTNEAFRSLIHAYAEERLAMIRDLPDIVRVNDDLVVGPTVTESRLRDMAAAGAMKSVLNLRSDSEAGSLGMGVLAKERSLVESLGLVYANVATTAAQIPTDDEVVAIKAALATLPKPVFMHCARMRRTAAVVRALGLSPMPDVTAPGGGSAPVLPSVARPGIVNSEPGAAAGAGATAGAGALRSE